MLTKPFLINIVYVILLEWICSFFILIFTTPPVLTERMLEGPVLAVTTQMNKNLLVTTFNSHHSSEYYKVV
jgi:hypothetical protein